MDECLRIVYRGTIKSMKISKKQKIMLDFVDGFIRGHGYSPTFREIMVALDYKSVSTVAKHIDNLVVLGYLVKNDGEARSLELRDPNLPAEKPWWHEIEKEIISRGQIDTLQSRTEADILRQALEIVKKIDLNKENI